MAVSFSGVRYKSVYEAMQDIVEQVKENTYHGEKLNNNLRRWAQAGV